MKWYLGVDVVFHRNIVEGVSTTSARFMSETREALNPYDLEDEIVEAAEQLNKQCESFTSSGSGWLIDVVKSIRIYTVKFNPITASSFIETPPVIAKRKAIINVKNKDNLCFVWSVLAALHPSKGNPHRVSNYMSFLPELNIHGLNFPSL